MFCFVGSIIDKLHSVRRFSQASNSPMRLFNFLTVSTICSVEIDCIESYLFFNPASRLASSFSQSINFCSFTLDAASLLFKSSSLISTCFSLSLIFLSTYSFSSSTTFLLSITSYSFFSTFRFPFKSFSCFQDVQFYLAEPENCSLLSLPHVTCGHAHTNHYSRTPGERRCRETGYFRGYVSYIAFSTSSLTDMIFFLFKRVRTKRDLGVLLLLFALAPLPTGPVDVDTLHDDTLMGVDSEDGDWGRRWRITVFFLSPLCLVYAFAIGLAVIVLLLLVIIRCIFCSNFVPFAKCFCWKVPIVLFTMGAVIFLLLLLFVVAKCLHTKKKQSISWYSYILWVSVVHIVCILYIITRSCDVWIQIEVH